MNYLIIGLGNVGEKYDQTRHNIGFDVVNALAKKCEAQFSLKKHAMLAETRIKNKTLALIKPTTFMNLSGTAVRYYMQEYKVEKENILVITDDLALPVGTLRLRAKGNHGGHNGLRDIQDKLNTQEYPRLRFGIGNDFDKHRQIDFVLGKWNPDEEPVILQKIDKAVECIHTFALEGISKAMTFYNG